MRPAEVVERLAALFPPLPDDEARIALTLYRRLSEGGPVEPELLASDTGLSSERVHIMLTAWPGVFRDEQRRVIGFWGLAQRPTQHRLTVAGRTLFTWCAWDALFIPPLLEEKAEVLSPSGMHQHPVRLTVTPARVTHDSSIAESLFVSFRLPAGEDWTADIRTTFCHHVFFLVGDEAERWTRTHRGSVVLPLQKAFEAGLRKNARQFGAMPLSRGRARTIA